MFYGVVDDDDMVLLHCACEEVAKWQCVTLVTTNQPLVLVRNSRLNKTLCRSNQQEEEVCMPGTDLLRKSGEQWERWEEDVGIT